MAGIQAVVARKVGVERFGVLASAFALATVLSGLIDFGAGSYWVREFAAGRLSPAEFGRRSSGKLVVGVAGALVIALAALLGLPSGFLLPASGLLLGSVVAQTFQAMLVAEQKNFRLSLYFLAERAVMVGVFVAAVTLSGLEPEGALVAAYVCDALTLALLTVRAVPEVRPRLSGISLRQTWAGAGFYGASTSLISLQSTDVLIAGALGGPLAVGPYGAVSRWTLPITLTTQSFSALLNPVVAAARDRRDVWRRIRRSIWLPGFSVLTAIAMAAFARPFVLLVLGGEFVGSIQILRFMALAAALSSLAQISFTVLQARRRERNVALAFAVAVMTQLVLVAILSRPLRALGLAISAVVGQGVLCFMLGVTMWRVLRQSRLPRAGEAAEEHFLV